MSPSVPSYRSAQTCARGFGLDQLAGHAHMVAGPAHAALEHVAHAEVTADGLHVDRLALVDECRVARDHEQPLDARQSGDDLRDHPVGEILLLSITAQIVKRQHGDRRPVSPTHAPAVDRLPAVVGDLADETDTLARHGADQALCLAAVADRLARGIDPAGQGRFRNDPPAPDRVQQIVLGDDAVAIADQVHQQVEDLRFEGNRFAAPPQFAALHVEHDDRQSETASRRPAAILKE